MTHADPKVTSRARQAVAASAASQAAATLVRHAFAVVYDAVY